MGSKRKHINSESSKNARATQRNSYRAAKKEQTKAYKAEHNRHKTSS